MDVSDAYGEFIWLTKLSERGEFESVQDYVKFVLREVVKEENEE